MDIRFNNQMDEHKVKEIEKGVTEFITKLAQKSGLVNDEMDSKKKGKILLEVLRETNAVYKTHLAASKDPDKVVDLSKHREITSEALIPLRLEGFSKTETRNFLAITKINQEAGKILGVWGIQVDEFLNMVREYRPFGIRVLYAQQMVLKIDEILKKEKSGQESDSLQ